MTDTASENLSVFKRGRIFLTETKDELKKISKPTRQETTQLTIAALFIICFVAISLMIIDLVFNRIMTAVLS